jgi:hypothetical protein
MGRRGQRDTAAVALTVILMCLWCSPASAYVDPNASGVLFQIVAPIVTLATAAIFFVRTRLAEAWRALRRRIKRTGTVEE